VNATTQSGSAPIAASSRLLDKALRFGLQLPVDLERLAVARGCDYYQRDFDPGNGPLPLVPLSNAELAIALVVPSLEPGAREIRLAAALLGAADVCAEEVAALALQEGCAHIIRYIALCGRRYEPDNAFWSNLSNRLPETENDIEGLPHPSRFVETTGIDRKKVGLFTRWIRPRLSPAA
jgi:hypothetical protein